ncbi:SDR family NAD(P)-dependent oxidoreductase [Streptomyces sp. MST-110588]|uniref:SDR family NAD(P)-dependent oxidoreductase n=1 Tax=Streptomyces sp. MST-110588 TaxID=2833628 RepID=UPI001F5C4AEE|nr:SDR family NAD(P)-dependent oxidoreductase [Streptomyces sp. MST-110588]UNO39202.1 SDR family NAD(P)-dependent oxidoreductase [Streptomyces sp. MST-110588]
MRIAGSTVLLTGVTGGIGRVLARRLAAAGAELIVTGRRAEVLRPLADELGARCVVADLADPQQVARLAEECAGTEILVANAALPASGDLLDYTCAQVDRALAVNLHAPVMLARLLAPDMVAAGRGHLAFVGSMSGKAATAASSLYTATKFGLRGFALSLRQDLRKAGVGVSVVQPGFVSEAGMFAATGATPPGGVRTVTPAQVADSVLRAVVRDECEVNIAPMTLRLRCAVASQFPAFAERARRRADTDDVTRQIVEAQRASR